MIRLPTLRKSVTATVMLLAGTFVALAIVGVSHWLEGHLERDERAMRFLELEVGAHKFSAAIERHAAAAQPIAYLGVDAQGRLSSRGGLLPRSRSLASLGMSQIKGGHWYFFATGHRLLAGRLNDERFAVWSVPTAALAQLKQQSRVHIGPSEPSSRSLSVAVPRSNMILSGRPPASGSGRPVESVLDQLLWAGLLLLVVLLILLQFPLARFSHQLRIQVERLKSIGAGDFTVIQPNPPGGVKFGEIVGLSDSLDLARSSMEWLSQRQTFEAQVQARSFIQRVGRQHTEALKNLAAPWELPQHSDIDFEVLFRPCAQPRGAWYQFRHDPDTDEVIAMVARTHAADGQHTCLSAAIIGAFEWDRQQKGRPFDPITFARSINQMILNLGRDAWHLSLTIAHRPERDSAWRVVNAGGAFPVVMNPCGDNFQTRPLVQSSDPLGVQGNPQLSEEYLEDGAGFTLVLHADGLAGVLNDEEQAFSRRRLTQVLSSSWSGSDVQSLARNLGRAIKQHRGTNRAQDDLCFLFLRSLL